MSALAELRGVYRERFARPPERALGVVGADVPRELVEASGHVALRLAPLADVDRSFADRALGRGVGEAARGILAALLEGAYPVERVVLCHDSDHTVRLYTALRRLAPRLDLWFLDLLHQPRATTDAYDRARLAELAGWLGGAGDLPGAIAAGNRARALGPRLAALRREGRIAGADALALLGAGTALPAARYAELLESALADAPERPRPRASVLLLGSEHHDDAVYASVDETGAAVVAETHGWGESLLAGRVDEDGDPLDALVRHYRPRPRVEPDPADVQVAWIAPGDEAVAWSLPAERRRLGREIAVARTLDELRQAVA
ncbi:MAG TPA: 2-hydroxyacyl-CoA dehydratase family protein [Gaiellaceae bacterium]|nr:2-hydroxyacyl-CoA dehydratase family protein [Gaiellaceae bacterium]